ncbi:PREDICTED: protein MALE DISCOVERER 2-like isoform X2 [Tarenaya hassleriana]|uniref:protein MALE DISCOVERER 2-like isoform X2 n=1 Tax=Tarenaya hassleriana TaxID=28532 RepID=UPI00053C5104|nr:PREDICTED: protein MALE DISCOVERER 2-like isoform X2 [Tarenaya hassleriana]
MCWRWGPIGFQLSCFMYLIIGLQTSSFSLDSEGFALSKFRARIDSDPHGALANWDGDKVCSWSGVNCVDGKVQMLCSLEGTLAPELSQLTDLRFLILSKNHFFGGIPKEFGAFTKLEILDLQDNNLSGQIPAELSNVLSLKHLSISGNRFEGEVQFNRSLEHYPLVFGCANRKLGHCVTRSSFIRPNKAGDFMSQIKATYRRYINAIPFKMFNKGSLSDHEQNFVSNLPSYLEEGDVFKQRRLLEETSNLAAMPTAPAAGPSPGISPEAFSRSSGSFPAVPNAKKRTPPLIPLPPSPPRDNNIPNTKADPSSNPSQDDRKSEKHVWLYVVTGLAAFVIILVIVAVIVFCRRRAAKTIGPWKTGLSGQLQKAFVTGVPKLNRHELETACEDFSNIIEAFDGYTVYKGTLSSGVEIAVVSTAISASKEWTRAMEMAYRRKIDTLSRINHKNFVNLIGYCEEDEPFNRMMVFEYAPNGNLYEHLHDEEMEHLDWSARMRIIMGMAYCLQYMHELNPHVAHSNLSSSAIYLTDDYAAKVAEVPFSSETGLKPRKSGDLDQSVLPVPPEPESNVYTYGVLLLEIISGKLSYSDEGGSIEQWASKCLESENLGDMVDPTLKSFKYEELEIICNVTRQCLRPEPRDRPTMKEVAEQLEQVINISPDQATPRLSPLWWAELEILSSEAT